jgi:hypothetical protein
VNAARIAVQHQGSLEMLDSPQVVASGEGDASEADVRGGSAGIERERAREQRPSLYSPPLVEIRVSQPHERGHIIRASLQRTLEVRRCLP